MKKLFNRENLIIFLILGLIGHNLFLQFQLEKVIKIAEEAEFFASEAVIFGREIASNASNAATNSANAVILAEDILYSARDASNNAYGNVCYRCPSD